MASAASASPRRNKRVRWTASEFQTLLLHVEVFGPKWTFIGASMRRTPSSIQHKLRRELDRECKHEAEAEGLARAQLRLVQAALDRAPPEQEGRAQCARRFAVSISPQPGAWYRESARVRDGAKRGEGRPPPAA